MTLIGSTMVCEQRSSNESGVALEDSPVVAADNRIDNPVRIATHRRALRGVRTCLRL